MDRTPERKTHDRNKNRYGAKVENDIGVFQGSAISALLFIIYLDDMMDDYTSINDNTQIPKKYTPGRCEQEQLLVCKMFNGNSAT